MYVDPVISDFFRRYNIEYDLRPKIYDQQILALEMYPKLKMVKKFL